MDSSAAQLHMEERERDPEASKYLPPKSLALPPLPLESSRSLLGIHLRNRKGRLRPQGSLWALGDSRGSRSWAAVELELQST